MQIKRYETQIVFNHFDPRQKALVDEYVEQVRQGLKALDEKKRQLRDSEPDHVRLLRLDEESNLDFNDLALKVAAEFEELRQVQTARFEELQRDLSWRWERLMEPAIKGDFDSWEFLYNHKTKTSTMKGIAE